MKTKFLRFLAALGLFVVACSQTFAQPLITLQPQNILNLLLGNTATFSVAATSTATSNLQYQWLKNGVRIPGATNSTLTINGTQATDSGAFTCRVNDGVGVVESSVASLTVNILTLLGDTLLNTLSLTNGQIRSSNIGDLKAPGEPDIVPGDPGGSAVWYSWTPLLGGVATFTTLGSDFDTILGVYTGSAPDNLVPVPSAINNDDGGGYLCSRLTFNASALTTYLINVDGYYGTQGNIVLTWGVALGDSLPSASATPATATAPSTNSVQLSSPWTGKKCDWLFNNVVVAANVSTLTVTNLNDSTVGSYVARFTTANGSVAYARPTSLQQNTIQDGTSATNSFAWNKFLDSANAAYAPTGSPQKMDGGDSRGYSVAQVYNTQGNSDEPGEPMVCNQDGGSPSWYTYVTPASGTMVLSTAGSSFNTILGVYVGNGNSFNTLTNVGCGYTTNYALDGQPIVEIPNVSAHQTNYILVEGESGASGTVHLNISLGNPVSINSAPANQAAGPGTNVTLGVSASGATPLSYIWQFNGSNIPGATNGSLTISNMEPSQAGTYTVVVSNRVSATSAQATVSFVQPPEIVNPPSNQMVCFGSSATFNCSVTGDAPLTYQWQHGGTNCASATNSSLTVASVQMSDAGNYSCLASNLAGEAISPAAMLTVVPAAPSVTWSSPAPIVYGTALSSSQLDATASVPGAFSYTPALGSVLNVGTQTLSVVFIPTDTSDYSNVTNTVNLVVSPATLTVAAKNRTKAYGQTVNFAGTEFTTSGLVSGDAVNSVTLSSSGAAATAGVSNAPYSIVASTAIGTGLSNYTIGYVNGTLNVNPATLIVTANSRTKTYGKMVTFAGTEFITAGLVNGDSVTGVTLVSSGATASASVAGSPFSIVPSRAVGSGLGNYAITYAAGALAVNAATLTVTANNRSKTYGQTVTFAGTEFTTMGLVNGDSVTGATLSSSGAVASASVAGSPFSIVPSGAVGSGLGNYAITYAAGALAVNAATLTVTANNRSKIYGQTVAFAGTEFTTVGLVNGDSVTGVTLASAGATTGATVAGSPFSIVPSAAVGSGLGNYAISYGSGALAVNVATLTVTANSRSKTYGQTVTFAGTEFATAGLVNGDSVTGVTLASSGATTGATVAGSPFSIVPSAAVGSGLGNYAINYANGALAVNAAILIVTANNRSKTYGQTVAFAGTEFTSMGLINGDSVTGLTLTSSGAAATATVGRAPYSIVPSAAIGSGLGNYTISYVSGTLNVNSASLTITANNRSKKYGQSLSFAGTEFTTTGLVNADAVTDVSLTSTGSAVTATVAGSPYSIVVSGAVGNGLSNYAIAYVVGILSVNPATLTVTANSRVKTYGQIVSFAGTEFATAGLVNGDSVTGVTLASFGATASATVAGSPFTIVPSGAVGSGLGNYAIGYVSGTLSVNPSTLTVTANNRTKTYGQTVTFAGTEFTTEGLVNGDSVTGVTLVSPGTAVTATVGGAPYSIVPSAAIGSGLGNYTITYANGALNVNSASLTITANNRSKKYGQSVSFAGTEFTTSGLVNADVVNGVSLTSTGSAATATVAGSPYTIIPSAATGTGLNNYAITYASGTLTIGMATLTVTAINRSKTYGQTVTLTGSEFTTVGLLNNDSVGGVTLASSGAAASATVAGSPYPITVGSALGTGLNNYTINYASGTLTINPAPLIVMANNRSKTYGQTVVFAGSEFTAAGLLNADTIASVTFLCASGVATAPVANYSIAPSLAMGTGLGNYSITYANGTLTVNPASLSIQANNLTKTYGQTVTFAGTEFTASGLLNSDTVKSVTLTSAGTPASATVAGSPYSIVPSAATGAGLSNYVTTYANGVITVGASAVTMTWPAPSPVIYGTPLNSGQLNATANIAGTFTYSPINGTVINAGTNTLSVIFSPTDSLDYGSVTNTVNFVVTPATLTVAAANASRVYGQANPALTGTVTGTTNGDNIAATFTTVATANSPLGSYAIVPILADPNNRETNYTVNVVNGMLAITQAAPIVAWTNPAPIIYGSALTSNQLNASTGVPGTFAYIPPIGTVLDSGTNALSVIFTPADSVDYLSVTDTVIVVILPAPLTVSASNVSRPFDTANPLFTGSISGLTNGDNISATYSCNATVSSSVGTYTIVPNLIDPANRQTNYVVNLLDGILVVGHPMRVFAWTNPAPIIYGTPLSAVQLTAAANIPGSYAYTPSNGTVLSSGTNMLSVVFTPADSVDYTAITDTVSLVVVPAPLVVIGPALSKVYGQVNPEMACSFSGITNGDSVTNACSCPATTASPVGTYPVVPSAVTGNDLTNYTITYVNGSLAINPASLTITANNNAKIYGQALSFVGTEFTAAGLVGEDSVTSVALACSGGAPTAVVAGSPYEIVPSAAMGLGLSNYTINYVGGTLNVNPAQLTVTANSANKTYGQTITFAGAEFTASGLINGDTVTGAALGSSGAVATAAVAGSPYFVVPNAAVGLGLGNYSIKYVAGSLTVNPASLTIAANNLNKVYGQTLNFAGTEFTANGLVNGDTVNSVVLTSAGTSAIATVAGSPYNIVPSAALGTGLANYTVTYVDGVLAVNGSVPIVTWINPASIIYGTGLGTNQLDAAASVDGSFIYTPTNDAVLEAGTNTLSVVFTPSDTGDYACVTNSVSLIVAPAPLTITATSVNRSFGQDNPWLAATITGLTNGDNITTACNCGATNGSTIGTYVIVPSLIDPANRQTNYTVSFVSGTLTVMQAAPLVNWSAPSPISYGAALSQNELDASANVAGSFAYTPPIGSVLGAGANTLSAVFTPDDTMDYSSVTNVVSLLVVTLQAPQLQTVVQGSALVLSWPTNSAGATLEMTTDLTGPWVPVTGSVVVGDQIVLTTNMTGLAAFFRLKQ